MIRKLLTRWLGLEHLQKAHDLRAVLNSRLSAENQRLRKELNRKPKKTNVHKHLTEMETAYAHRKALMHIERQRQNILIDMLRDYVADDQFIYLCDKVHAMTDEQVTTYEKPQRVVS